MLWRSVRYDYLTKTLDAQKELKFSTAEGRATEVVRLTEELSIPDGYIRPSSLTHETTLSSALPENMALSDPEADKEEPTGVARVVEAEGEAVEVDQEPDAEECPKVVEVSDGDDVSGEESDGEKVDGEESDCEKFSGEELGGKELAVEDEHPGRYNYGIDEEEVESPGDGADSDTYGTPAPDDVTMIDESPDCSAGSEIEAQALDKSMAGDDHPFSDDDA